MNRLLKSKRHEIASAWQKKLDVFLGTSEWQDAFYKTSDEQTLFGKEAETSKIIDVIPAITNFYQRRLATIFPKVVSNPRYLFNSRNSPMFLFTFAVSNPSPTAQGIALNVAQHILGKKR